MFDFSFFTSTAMTRAVNAITNPSMVIFNKYFRRAMNMQMSDQLMFDIITGNETILPNLSVTDKATVVNQTGRKTVTMMAPRLAPMKLIHAGRLVHNRQYGQLGIETLQQLWAREIKDLRNSIDYTWEFWSVSALKGTIYDSDLTTVIFSFNLPGTHDITLTGTDLWSDAGSKPINNINDWKRLIRDDSKTFIRSWDMYVGHDVANALVNNVQVKEFLAATIGNQVAESGYISRLAQTNISEYDASFLDSNNARTRLVEPDEIMLIGDCDDLTDAPYARVVDLTAPNGVGNTVATGNGSRQGVPIYSTSWDKRNPSSRAMMHETRLVPALKRPGAVLKAKVL